MQKFGSLLFLKVTALVPQRSFDQPPKIEREKYSNGSRMSFPTGSATPALRPLLPVRFLSRISRKKEGKCKVATYTGKTSLTDNVHKEQFLSDTSRVERG